MASKANSESERESEREKSFGWVRLQLKNIFAHHEFRQLQYMLILIPRTFNFLQNLLRTETAKNVSRSFVSFTRITKINKIRWKELTSNIYKKSMNFYTHFFIMIINSSYIEMLQFNPSSRRRFFLRF